MIFDKQQLLIKLAEVEAILQNVKCDGEPLTSLECWADVGEAFNKLQDAVEYYVD